MVGRVGPGGGSTGLRDRIRPEAGRVTDVTSGRASGSWEGRSRPDPSRPEIEGVQPVG